MRTVASIALTTALAIGATNIAPLSAAENVDAVDQGWTEQQRQAWYDATVGSRMLPLSWLLALEEADSTEPFLSAENARRWKLPMRSWQGGNLQLPRGMAVDVQDDSWLSETRLRWKAWQSPSEPWVGLNCASCHTVDITYKGASLTVDGGSTMSDSMQLINESIIVATKTIEDAAKFDRFARAVLGPDTLFGTGYNEANKSSLRNAVTQRINSLQTWLRISHNDVVPGPGRMDATGMVLNKMAMNSRAANLTVNPTDAPTNVPALWRTMQVDKLQSNGFAPNLKFLDGNGHMLDLGYLAGDVGVVTGAFGDVASHPLALLEGYASSIRVGNLIRVDDLIQQLKPPAWPSAVLGGVNTDLLAEGAVLYAGNCASCHAPIDRSDLRTPLKLKQVRLKAHDGEAPIGTDPWMACNTYTFTSPSGNYFGLPILPIGTPTKFGIVGAEAKIADMQPAVALQIILGKKLEMVAGTAEIIAGILFGNVPLPTSSPATLQALAGAKTAESASTIPYAAPPLLASAIPADKAQRKEYCLNTDHDFLGYIARPLNGIWATAPYLHNGSVPTLYDLLLPAEQRPRTFYTGTSEFDPVKVGYVTASGGDNSFLFDTTVEGNSNAGHEFGSSLTASQRLALLEYIKTL